MEREGKQYRDEQYLEDLTLGKGADHGRRNDVQQIVDGVLRLGLRRVTLDRFGVDGAGVDIHPGAGLPQIDDDQPDKERQGRDHLEIEDCLQADPADFLHVVHAGDAMHDRAEDDRRDQHLDGLDKRFAERLHLDRQRRVEMAEQNPDQDRADNLEVKMTIERLAPRASHGSAPPTHHHQAFLRREAAGAAGSATGSSFFFRPPDTGSSSAL